MTPAIRKILLPTNFGPSSADAIVDAAIAPGLDLIVMSAPAGGRLPSLMMESVAEQVRRAAPGAVLAVRQSGAARVHAGKRVA